MKKASLGSNDISNILNNQNLKRYNNQGSNNNIQ